MFKVGLTRDFLTKEGELSYKSIGLDIFDDYPEIEYEFLKNHLSPVTPDLLQGYDAIISLTPAYNQDSFKGVDTLKAICRFGVGYDMVDVDACTDANVMLTITRGAVNHSVAEATIMWMLTLSYKTFIKNQLVRQGQWAERSKFMGSEIRGHTIGIIGLGGIGTTLVEMLSPFKPAKIIAFDPYADADKAKKFGVELVALNDLMKVSDFISVNCPLTDETRNMIKKEQLELCKNTAYIINTARGGIINYEALLDSLKNKSIAGYATDVFDQEPPSTDDPLLQMESVIVAPHAIAWTDELFETIGRMACEQVVQIYKGEKPDHLINEKVFKNIS
jgi:phosphoglycerate dehydrogenase-like enzyme